MYDVSWVFSGIGSTLIGLVFGAIGGVIGYKIKVTKDTIKQTQKNKGNGNQVQVGVQQINK